MAEVTAYRAENSRQYTVQEAVVQGVMLHLRDGQPGYYPLASGEAAGERVSFETNGQVVVTKPTGIVILDGQDVFWDWTNSRANFKATLNSKDFFAGRAVGDAASADTTMTINLGKWPNDLYADIDLLNDPLGYLSVFVGTQGLNTMGIWPRGGMNTMILSSTSEAQKMDMLTVKTRAVGTRGILKAQINVISGGAGSAPDFNLAMASGTHATDFDSVTQACGVHLDGNSTNISFFSRDGTTTVAITDSTTDYTAGTPFEVVMDFRDPTSVKMYVEAVRVLSASTFNVNAAASAWKLIAHLEKTSAADVFEVACRAVWRDADQSTNGV